MSKLRDEIPKRSYKGEMWITNKTNKKYLAIDFKNRCCYCNDHHNYSGGYNFYHVEHFAPKEKFSPLKFRYDNLLYSCSFCNTAKLDKWVGKTENQNVVGNKGFIDPCTKDYDKHLGRKKTGEIYYKTKLGEYMYDNLKLGLSRHAAIYKINELSKRLEKLEKIIQKKKKSGKDNKVELELYFLVNIELKRYYKELFTE